MTLHSLYTWGYTGAKPPDLRKFAYNLNATVVDIRYSPRSRVQWWNGPAIKALLPDARYMHMIELGNKNYNNGGPIELYRPEDAVRDIQLILTYHPAILLCACAQWETCHRRAAADFLRERLGCQVWHLPTLFADYDGIEELYARP